MSNEFWVRKCIGGSAFGYISASELSVFIYILADCMIPR